MLQKIDIITLFPEIVESYISCSVIGKAINKEIVSVIPHQLRDYSLSKHGTVDDIPYGGSVGMVLEYAVLKRAMEAVGAKSYKINFSPTGIPISMDLLRFIANKDKVLLMAGHYEGLDKRSESLFDLEVSLGDFVLTGGELPAITLTDAVIRLIPGVLGNDSSVKQDSFFNGLLDWDVYTRPQMIDNKSVPKVLFSGHHKKIEQWKKRNSLIKTMKRRSDLFARYKFDSIEKNIIKKYWLEEDNENE